MKATQRKLTALLALCFILAGCAQTGPPLPPSLELPKPPTDLRATRKGNMVTLTWSEPTLTTDRQTVRYLGPTLICRSSESDMPVCGSSLAMVPPPAAVPTKLAKKTQPKSAPEFQTYTDTLSSGLQSDNPDAQLTYAVEVLNRNARGAGLSNRVHVSAITTLPAPNNLTAKPTDDGVDLTWTSVAEPPTVAGVQYRYRIYRKDERAGNETTAGRGNKVGAGNKKDKNTEVLAAEVAVGPAGPEHFLDTIEWERTYDYRITAVTIIIKADSQVQVEGNDSPQVRVVAHDIFPPSVPSGLQAVYSGEGQKPFIDLIWAPVPSADLAGYNVYRSEGEAAPIKMNSDLVKTPSYRDMAVSAGKTYTYFVSAVDARNNESQKSEAASEAVP
jgi:predicted small lipoprotein YifL